MIASHSSLQDLVLLDFAESSWAILVSCFKLVTWEESWYVLYLREMGALAFSRFFGCDGDWQRCRTHRTGAAQRCGAASEEASLRHCPACGCWVGLRVCLSGEDWGLGIKSRGCSLGEGFSGLGNGSYATLSFFQSILLLLISVCPSSDSWLGLVSVIFFSVFSFNLVQANWCVNLVFQVHKQAANLGKVAVP